MKKTLILALAALFCHAAMAQTQVTGTVTSSEDGTPVSFATVVVKGNSRLITTTDADGKFALAGIPANGVLVVSYIGFTTQEVPVNGRTVVDIIVSPDATALEEVMVVAYGTVKRESYTGAASVVRAEQLKDIPVVSFEQAFAGNATGIQLGNTSGLPGSFPQIRIRGVGSMNAGNDPLYVIDGIPAISGDLSASNTGTSAMNFLNPGDIESITILKDAAAAALYGSRASNGVILITTKKGRAGKTRISFKNNLGFTDFAFNNFPLASEEETEMLHREAWTNYATDNPSVWNNVTFGSLDKYVDYQLEWYYPARRPGYGYVDWEDALFRTAISRTHELSLSGGTENTRIFLSGAYSNNEAVSKARYLNRLSGTLNVDHKANKWMSIGANIQFAHTKQEGNQESGGYDNPWWAVKSFVPYRWPAYNPDGTLFREWPVTTSAGLSEMHNYTHNDGNRAYKNPLINAENLITNSAQTRLIMKPYIELSLLQGLKVKSIFGFDGMYILDKFGWLPEHANGQAYGNGYYSEREQTITKIVSSTTLNYSKTIADDHNISAMVGWEAEDHNTHYARISKSDLYSTSVISTTLASGHNDAYGNTGRSTLLSFISSLNYDYKSKYYFTATYRTDGSSRLAADKRWGDFWSVSGSWRIINESFMKDILWLTDLRLKASYGVSGTLPSSFYYHKSFYGAATSEQYGPEGGFRITTAYNPNLTWEKNRSSNFALEAMVFNRAKLSVDFYTKLTTDLLMNATTASISGLTSYLRNVGNMRNRGVEIDVNVDVVKTQDLTWSVGVNWTLNKNEITKMSYNGEEIVSGNNIRKAGYSYYQFYTREYLGVEQDTGRPMFASNAKKNDGTLDKAIVYDARNANNVLLEGITGDPDGYGGISTIFRYKGLSISAVFNYMYGHYVFDQTQDQTQADGGTQFLRSISKEQLRRWQKKGDITDVPRRIPYVYAGYYNSSRMALPGDFIRLKNMTVSYNLPQNWMRRVHLESVRIYASGTNLLTFTGLYFDPELANYGGYVNFQTPPVRTVSFGIEITL